MLLCEVALRYVARVYPPEAAPKATRVVLRSGADLAVECLEPPLPAETASRVFNLVSLYLKEDFLPSILAGELSGHARFAVWVGRINAEIAGACWIGRGSDFPDIAVMGGVATHEAYRGCGIASAVIGQACRRFDESGGRLLFLGTTNPVAQHIYEKLGFSHVAGHVFCRAAPGARMDEGFVRGRKVSARPASYRDVAAVVPLYLFPHASLLLDSRVGLPSIKMAAPWRCVRIFWDLWQSVGSNGQWMVLQNDCGWVVASALASPSVAPDGHSPEFSMDFVWHPGYSMEGRAFVAEFLADVEKRVNCGCEMRVCRGDGWKSDEAVRLGFEPADGPGGAVEIEGRRWSLVRFVRKSKR